ncbi:alternative ribosome rescue aminoacyl-tRNA hydrolase ArfB [Nocardia carnea]|uniref:alternative ribosome rescue aminoacyl-tRNA hydrolase ArfB n=1 Tax=Nocardia carnea TaxID=37328 RepID=UPI0024550D0E|nr:alternative ribosome rescue aminoacyl-tRNA hydrolase ArfB [Nocardia carnea]
MAADLTVTRTLVIPASELHERFSRSSGPGGQHVNTTDSRVELSFDLAGSPSVPEWLRTRMLDRLAGRLVGGVLTIAASEHRAQLQNRAAARERLAALLRAAAAAPPPVRRATKPSRGAKERRIAAKKRRGITKRNRRAFPDD